MTATTDAKIIVMIAVITIVTIIAIIAVPIHAIITGLVYPIVIMTIDGIKRICHGRIIILEAVMIVIVINKLYISISTNES